MVITIVTATYNRSALLMRLFDSLVAQHYREIEWIVVDDGGSDHTEEVIRKVKETAEFTIRFAQKENSGKDATVNVGLEMATGDLVAVIDDDDYFLPNMFSRVAQDFAAIASDKCIAGLSYLATDSSGKIWGKKFPHDGMVSNHFECRINKKIWGDKCEFTKAVILRNENFRFLETKMKGGFGADTLFLAKIAEQYETRYFNTPVLVKNFYHTGIAANWRKRGLQNPELAAAYYTCFLQRRVRLHIRLRYMVAYIAITSYSGGQLLPPVTDAPWTRTCFYLAYIPGRLVGTRWRHYDEGSFPQAKHLLRTKI